MRKEACASMLRSPGKQKSLRKVELETGVPKASISGTNPTTGSKSPGMLARLAIKALQCGPWEVAAVLCHCSVTTTTLAPDTGPNYPSLAVGGLSHQLLCGRRWRLYCVTVLLQLQHWLRTLDQLPVTGCRRSTTSTVVCRVEGGGGCIVSLFCYNYNTGSGHWTNYPLLAVGGPPHQLLCVVWKEVAAVLCHCSVTTTTLAQDTGPITRHCL
ncbi:hypothetical protein J6590_041408 [Homalodisca vitripennis]|nr:hypothetical protein J6590_041408 [Homalodisca vitripennis]